MANILKQYKLPAGKVDYGKIFHVPTADRIAAVYERDFMYATALVGAAITMAFEKMTFKKKIDGVLINNIAEEVVDSAGEDNISFEDLMLFLQNMVKGFYGNIEDISVTKFCIMFNKYRDDRHEAILEYRWNEHLNHKSMGDSERSFKEDALSEHMSRLGDTIGRLKEDLRETRKENNVLKQVDRL